MPSATTVALHRRRDQPFHFGVSMSCSSKNGSLGSRTTGCRFSLSQSTLLWHSPPTAAAASTTARPALPFPFYPPSGGRASAPSGRDADHGPSSLRILWLLVALAGP